MIRKYSLHILVLLAVFSLAACSGPKTTGGGGGSGNAAVSFTMVADTLPTTISLLSFRVSIASVTLTPTSGTAITLTPATPVAVDLMRMQSDTAFIGSLATVPAGTYTVSVNLTGSSITFLNNSGSTITVSGNACDNNVVCSFSLSALGTASVSNFTFTASSGGTQGIELDFNLNNAITITAGTLTVNFAPTAPAPGVFSAFTLPRTDANLSASQLEIIEDFTGTVSLSGSNVTITSPTRGTLTAALATGTNATFYDQSPSPGTLCANAPSTTSCAANGQIASVDAYVNSNGTLSLKEFEPLTSTTQDFVEGIVIIPNLSATEFAILVTDAIPAASGSLITGLTPGQFLNVNIPAAQFFVDTKGLAVQTLQSSNLSFFEGASDTSAIFAGQQVAVNVTKFTAAVAPNLPAATSTTVTLRWSRFIADVSTGPSSSEITISNLPGYFGAPSASSTFGVDVFVGTLGTDGVTNLDGVTDAGNLAVSSPVGLRTLFLESQGGAALVPFLAAKIRQQ